MSETNAVNKRREGSYVKAVGADWGIYWNGSKWISFECLGCEIARGTLIPSLRIPSPDISEDLRKSLGYNFKTKHDPKVHAKWLSQGKPFRKE